MTLRNFKSWKVRNSNGQRIDRVDRVLAWRVPHRRCWSKRFCRVDEWDVERELDLAELDRQDNKHDRCERRGYQRDHGITLWQDNPSLLNLEFVERDRPDDRFGAKVTIPLDDRGAPDRQFLCMRNCTDADQVPERSSRDNVMVDDITEHEFMFATRTRTPTHRFDNEARIVLGRLAQKTHFHVVDIGDDGSNEIPELVMRRGIKSDDIGLDGLGTHWWLDAFP